MRRVRAIVLWLVLGAIVNIAIAWAVTAWTAWPGGFASIEGDEQAIAWPGPAPDRWPPPNDLIRYRSFGWSLDRCVAIVPADDEGGRRQFLVQYMIETVRVGWPMRALRWERWVDGLPTQPAAAGTPGGAAGAGSQRQGRAGPGAWRSGIPLALELFGFDPDDGKRLPFCPLWGGFIINTVLYAIGLWLIIRAPRFVRGLNRITHGRCPECGYDLRGRLEAGCSECGWNRRPEART
jgi:hypothetical protein